MAMSSIASALRVRLAKQLQGQILDCGCGAGIFQQYFHREGNKVISLEMDTEALSQLKTTGVYASAAATPFVDNYFDAVWACAIMEHVKEETVPEWIRITRPGGRIIAVTPNMHSPWDNFKRLMGMMTWWENKGHIRLYSAREIQWYGPVIGETWFVPGFAWLFKRVPVWAHVLILDIIVTEQLKQRCCERFPEIMDPSCPKEVCVFL